MGSAAQDQASAEVSFEWVAQRSPMLALCCSCDAALTVRGVQGPCRELLGDDADGLLARGSGYASSIDARDREACVHALLDAARGEIEQLEHELRLTQPDAEGRERWVSQRVRVARDASGHAQMFEVLLVDISARKRLELTEDRRRRQQEVILELATHPATAEGRFDALSCLAAERLSEVCDVERVGVWLLNAERDELVLVDLHVRGSGCHKQGTRLSAHDYPAYFAALRSGLTIDAVDAATDPRTREFAAGYLASHDIHSLLDAAILVAGEVAGVLCLEAVGAAQRWTQHDLEFAAAIAAQLTLALHNRGHREARARERAVQDQLLHSHKMEALGRLAGGVAHDFNNQLMVMSASAQLLAGELSDPMQLTCAQHIVTAGERAAELVEQLQNFSRRQPAERHPLDLCALLAKLEPLVRRILGRYVRLSFSLSREPVTISASEDLIQQLLTSLVENARDAVREDPKRPGLVELSVEMVELREPLVVLGRPVEAGRYALIVVADDGEGMSPEVEARLFEPFFTTKEDGTGLGLATAYNITQRLEGSIKVASELGKGTRVYVFLPVV